MPLYEEGFGTALGNALGGATTNYLQTQNTLRQQDQQRQQQDADNAYREQQAAEQRRQYNTTADINKQNREVDVGRLALKDRGDEYTGILGPQIKAYMDRADQDATRYGPSMQLKDGTTVRNPQYRAELYEGAKTMYAAGQKAWSKLATTVYSGQGYEEAKGGLIALIGTHDTPKTQAAPPPMDYNFAPAAAPVPMAAPEPRGFTQANDVPAPVAAPVAAAPSTALPERVTSIPASELMNLPDDQLLARYGEGGMEYVTIARVEYQAQQAASRKAAFTAQNAVWKSVIDNITKDKDHPATATQIQAASMVTAYGSLLESGRELTTTQQAEYAAAITNLAPLVYTAATWQKIMETGKADVIAGAYDLYKKAAPDLVAGFDVTPFQTQVTDQHNQVAAQAYQNTAAGNKNVADTASIEQTTQFKKLFGGETKLSDVKDVLALTAVMNNPDSLALVGLTREVVERRLVEVQTGVNQTLDQNIATLGATTAGTRRIEAEIPGVVATTQKTLADTNKLKFDQGVAKLGQLAGTGATVYQLQHDGSSTWYDLKQQLHLSDGELAAVFQNARYEADQKAKGVTLDLSYKQSQILNLGAERAGIITTNAKNAQDTSLRAVLGGAATLDDVIAGKNSATLRDIAGDHNAKVLLRITDGGKNLLDIAQGIDDATAAGLDYTQAGTGSLTASGNNSQASANSTAALQQPRVDLIGGQIQNFLDQAASRKVRNQAYVASVESGVKLDAAKITQMAEDTLLKKAKREHPELFTTAGKAANPLTALSQRAEINYKQGRQAAASAAKLQTQINSLTPKLDTYNRVIGMPVFKGTAAEQTAAEDKWTARKASVIDGLTKQMNTLTQRSLNQLNAGDKIISDGLQTLPAPAGTPTLGAKVQLGLPSAQAWVSQNPEVPGVPSDCAAIAGKYLNDLGLSIPTSNFSAGLENNAKKSGWQSAPIAGLQQGDMVVWTGPKYGLQKTGGIGKHVGVVAEVVNGVPQILMNPGLLPDGTQGITKIVPMFDPGRATAYRAPGGKPQAAAVKPPPTSAAPAAAKVTVTAGTPLPKPPAQAAQPAAQTPGSVKPQGSVGAYMGKLASSGWITKAQNVTTKADSEKLLDAAARMVMPSGTPDQIKLLKGDLSKTMGW